MKLTKEQDTTRGGKWTVEYNGKTFVFLGSKEEARKHFQNVIPALFKQEKKTTPPLSPTRKKKRRTRVKRQSVEVVVGGVEETNNGNT